MNNLSETVAARPLKTALSRRLAFRAPAAAVVAFLLIAPAFIRPDIVSLLSKVLILGLLTLSVDLVMGYAGLWSFCQASLFGASAYAVGLSTKWLGVSSFWLAAPLGVAAAVIGAALFAALGLRSRRMYFLLITFAFGGLVTTVVQTSSYRVTGGSNGLWGIPYPDLNFALRFTATRYYYFCFAIVAICAIVLYLITRSPFGYSLIGIQDNEIRAKTLGYNTWLRKFVAFVLGGFFAGIAGVLWVFFNGGVAPADIGISASGMAVIMVVIGGMGTLWGAFVGSGLVLILNYFVSQVSSARWPLVLGAIFIAVVFFAQKGVLPLFLRLWAKVVGRERSSGAIVDVRGQLAEARQAQTLGAGGAQESESASVGTGMAGERRGDSLGDTGN